MRHAALDRYERASGARLRLRAGDTTSISSEQRNVHWFVARSDTVYHFRYATKA
jgi:hypothetical protein